MSLLPDSIDFDPSLEANLENIALVNGMLHCNTDTIKLWAKHFAPLGASDGLLVPTSWCDFITIMLLSPCDILTQCLIGLIEYPYHQGIPSFLKAYLQRTLGLSVLGLEQFQDG
jgi:hypothetical protein